MGPRDISLSELLARLYKYRMDVCHSLVTPLHSYMYLIMCHALVPLDYFCGCTFAPIFEPNFILADIIKKDLFQKLYTGFLLRPVCKRLK